MKNSPLPRLDENHELRERLLPYCRLKPGEIWLDPRLGHKVACIDAADSHAVSQLTAGGKASLAIQDPPYNVAAFSVRDPSEFIAWSRKWVANTISIQLAASPGHSATCRGRLQIPHGRCLTSA